ncbi:aspartate kinase [Aminivibrio pyruvatiphilus]|uniref:Aspartokinase n=1 Tax=Aminivibrio pyruvatiphilus TaxID=1005740 RepID=A0A4R8M1E4_9BACT|nr:aspartate kinase [Aminivibrio pyruvatiphilus]TDY55861.1 aspartate kinase [Aminivibrio pyruvatiphilus]
MIVQKYGGSSVATAEKIRGVAERIKQRVDRGEKLVVVVSAMGKTTNSLIALAEQVSQEPSPRELDMLLATGEQVTSALLAMALCDMGIPALSYNAFQLGLTTTGSFNNARIMDLNLSRLRMQLERRSVLVVTGFQGVTPEGDVTTLGRGGSDTSAVAIAAKCGCPCEIYSDVPGVFTCDPNRVPGARKLDYITYDEMLELSSLGAKVLHSRAVEIAKKYSVDLYCGSTFSDERGTCVVNSLPEWLEQPVVSGVTTDSNQTRLTISRLPRSMEALSALFTGLAEQGVNVDMISTVNENGHSHLTFTVVDATEKAVLRTVRDVLAPWEGWSVSEDRNVVKVSAVGVGMKSAPGVAARFISALSRKGIAMLGTTTSEIKISALVATEDGNAALRALVEEFGLGE